MFSVFANLKSSNIENVTLGVSKNDTNIDNAYDNKKKAVKIPLLRKQ